MELLNNCTLAYDIDAIVLHTDSDTMGENHVWHLFMFVISLTRLWLPDAIISFCT